MDNVCRFLITAVLVSSVTVPAASEDNSVFAAYYTKRDSGAAFEADSRTGEYADVVVRVDAGRELVFWRASSYLPHLRTPSGIEYVPELVPRSGDGNAPMPDRVNMFSRVRIIENSRQRAVVHWRYVPVFSIETVPNPFGPEGGRPVGVSRHSVVDEYFLVWPDGHVKRTIRQATPSRSEWDDPLNITVQEFDLTPSGIASITTTPPGSSPAEAPVAGNPLTGPNVVSPAAWWKFDEGAGAATSESVRSTSCSIAGDQARWRPGISGTALHGDGYGTAVTLPGTAAPTVDSELTLEGWVSLGAYPLNEVPLVRRGEDYLLGVTGHGYPVFRVTANGTPYEVRVPETLESDHATVIERGLYADNLETGRWYHLAGTVSIPDGEMVLYVDGQEVARATIAGEGVLQASPGEQVVLCHNPGAVPVDSLGEAVPAPLSLDGLIDEVKVYSIALDAQQIRETRDNFHPGGAIVNSPAVDQRLIPAASPSGDFGASYGNFTYHKAYEDLWRFGDHADVAVQFEENPSQLVFWHGAEYIPFWMNDADVCSSNGFNETWGTSGAGASSQEPFSERRLLINHVRLIENTPARAVVHWRYTLLDIEYRLANYNSATGWSDWADWYYTIYPDGTAFKRARLWSELVDPESPWPLIHEWQESQVLTWPGQHPENQIEAQGIVNLGDLEGNLTRIAWPDGFPADPPVGENRLHLLDVRGEWDPFTLCDLSNVRLYHGEVTNYSNVPTWSHWPAFHAICSGRLPTAADRPAHGSFSWLECPDFDTGPDYFEKIYVEGMSNALSKDGLGHLPELYRSWASPPPITASSGLSSAGYDRRDGAYHLTRTADAISLTIGASEDSPLQNPAFVIRNWDSRTHAADVSVSGAAPRQIRQGTIVDTDGTFTKVIWMEMAAKGTVDVEIIRRAVNGPDGWMAE